MTGKIEKQYRRHRVLERYIRYTTPSRAVRCTLVDFMRYTMYLLWQERTFDCCPGGDKTPS